MELIKVEELDFNVEAELKELFTGNDEGFLCFGESKYVLPRAYSGHQDTLRQMELRADDVWVASYPRSGTTWTQEMVWLINNDLDYENAKKTTLVDKYNFIEVFCLATKRMKDMYNKLENMPRMEGFRGEGYSKADAMTSPRHFKTHLPLSLLSPSLLDTSRVVYVARDPRDVAVSFYHLNKFLKVQGYVGDFRTYWGLFRNNLVLWCPYFAHLKEAWALRDHPNMLFIFYEELSADLKGVIGRVGAFLGKQYGEQQVHALCEHLHIDRMKGNKPKKRDDIVTPLASLSLFVNVDGQGFVRKGKVGGWRQYFDEEMTKEAEKWIEDNIRGTDIKFPGV